MKTTLEIKDELLIRARQLARRSGKPLRAVVEDSSRLAIAQESELCAYELPDCKMGRLGATFAKS